MSVFRALSPSCDCDLAVLKNCKLIRVEVTTGYTMQNGALSYHHHDTKNYDVIAVVHKGGISYFPETFCSPERVKVLVGFPGSP